MPPKTRVLITGATGFIGRPLCDALYERGYEVHRTSRSARRWPGGTWHRFDLLSDAPEPLIQRVRPDVVIHAAWIAPPADYRDHTDNPAFAERTLQLARSAEAHGARRQIFVGSSVDGGEDGSAYAKAKSTLRAAVSEQLESPWSWARPFLVYGPGEAPNRLIPSIARALSAGMPARISAGAAVRDFVHVEDVTHALALLVDADHTGPIDIGTGRAMSVAQVARKLAQRARRPDLLAMNTVPARDDEADRLVADTRDLRRLGALPRIPLELGLDEALALHRRRLEHAA